MPLFRFWLSVKSIEFYHSLLVLKQRDTKRKAPSDDLSEGAFMY